jgi:uncharacterized protein DUF3365
MKRWVVAMALAAMAHAACAEEDLRKLTEESRKVANDLVAQVRSELVRELEMSGPLKAVIVCKYTVPEITSAISRRTGWRVTRVSLRPRNPGLAAPDAWEQKVLMEFDRRAGEGEKVETLEHAEIVQEPAGRFFRYMKALPLVPMCMTCHGPPDKMSEALRVQLAHEYPFDKAVGSAVGQVRGATTVKRPL